MKNLNHDSALYKACLLGCLCAICGLLLSVVNSITAPIIAENQIATIKASLEEIYPGATFNDVTTELAASDETGLIDGIYEAEGKGYVFTLHGMGYNSNGFTFMVGFDNDGKISGYKALEQQETSGIGARAFEPEYTGKITALTSSDPVPLLSGATLTSTAVAKGIDAAKAVFNNLKGISYDPNASAPEPEKEAQKPLLSEDFSATKVTCEEISNDGATAVYHCTAVGFEGTNEADVTVDIASGTIKNIAVTAFNDTPGVGDGATADAELARYAGKGLNDIVDSTTGASMTSRSLRAMAAYALSAATGTELDPNASAGTNSGPTLGSEDYSENSVACRVFSNVDPKAFVYKCKAMGYGGVTPNEATITVDSEKGTITSIEVTAFNDTPGVGDAATAEAELARYVGASLDSAIDATSGATFTSKSLRAMAAYALSNATGTELNPSASAGTSSGPALGTEDFSANSAACRVFSNVDPKAFVYKCSAMGYGGVTPNEATVTVDTEKGTITSIEVTAFNDTPGVGDAAAAQAELARYAGASLDSAIDATSGATFTSASIRAMAAAALNMAAGK